MTPLFLVPELAQIGFKKARNMVALRFIVRSAKAVIRINKFDSR